MVHLSCSWCQREQWNGLLVLLNEFEELIIVGTRQAVKLLAILHEQKSRHACNLVILGNVFTFIHIHLQENDIAHRLTQLLQLRCDHFARPTPGGVEVDDNQLVSSLVKLLSEIFLVFHLVNHLGECGKAVYHVTYFFEGEQKYKHIFTNLHCNLYYWTTVIAYYKQIKSLY